MGPEAGGMCTALEVAERVEAGRVQEGASVLGIEEEGTVRAAKAADSAAKEAAMADLVAVGAREVARATRFWGEVRASAAAKGNKAWVVIWARWRTVEAAQRARSSGTGAIPGRRSS